MLMVGVAAIALLNVAVMVTTIDPETKLSESESVRMTSGVLETLKVILSVPEYTFPTRSVPDTVAVVEFTEVDTVQV